LACVLMKQWKWSTWQRILRRHSFLGSMPSGSRNWIITIHVCHMSFHADVPCPVSNSCMYCIASSSSASSLVVLVVVEPVSFHGHITVSATDLFCCQTQSVERSTSRTPTGHKFRTV